jgi:hypothetical protein
MLQTPSAILQLSSKCYLVLSVLSLGVSYFFNMRYCMHGFIESYNNISVVYWCVSVTEVSWRALQACCKLAFLVQVSFLSCSTD